MCVGVTSCGWMRECVVPVLCQRMCQWAIQVNPTKDGGVNSQLLCPSVSTTYRHPSSCPALCHASQGDADGFTLDLALSPLSLRLSSPPSRLHLSAICSILLTSFLPCYLAHSLISPFSCGLSTHVGGCLLQEFYCQDLQESARKHAFEKRWSSLINPVSPSAVETQSLSILNYSESILSLGITLHRFGEGNTLWHNTDPRW